MDFIESLVDDDLFATDENTMVRRGTRLHKRHCFAKKIGELHRCLKYITIENFGENPTYKCEDHRNEIFCCHNRCNTIVNNKGDKCGSCSGKTLCRAKYSDSYVSCDIPVDKNGMRCLSHKNMTFCCKIFKNGNPCPCIVKSVGDVCKYHEMQICGKILSDGTECRILAVNGKCPTHDFQCKVDYCGCPQKNNRIPYCYKHDPSVVQYRCAYVYDHQNYMCQKMRTTKHCHRPNCKFLNHRCDNLSVSVPKPTWSNEPTPTGKFLNYCKTHRKQAMKFDRSK